jgi:arsenate reductase
VATEDYNVLFLCTGNSARSQIAECLLNSLGRGRLKAYSAGSHPTGEVHPHALELLRRRGHAVERLRSKDWAEFAAEDALKMDLIITVCDNAAREVCPVWPGHPMTAHLGLPDPAAVTGTQAQRQQAFEEVYRELLKRLEILVNLAIEDLDSLTLKRRIEELGIAKQPI